MNDLPTYVPCTRKRALEIGADFIELEVRKMRADAQRADATTTPVVYAERLLLDVMDKCQAAAILRTMAEREQ